MYLKDIWPDSAEVQAVMKYAADPETYRRLYSDLTQDLPLWNAIPAPTGNLYQWDESTYIAQPPFFDTSACSPAASATSATPRRWRSSAIRSPPTTSAPQAASSRPPRQASTCKSKGVAAKDFNSYGSRRGNHEVMMRGTFANVRIKNLMLPPKDDGSRVEGGYTLYKGEQMAIYDAAMKYIADGTPTVIFAGEEYGTGSSRDWAAKGTQLLGVKAVIAKSYERIHRSNLVGMGVLPLQFKGGDNVASLQPDRRRDLRHRRHRRQPEAATGRDADHHAQGWQHAASAAAAAHRHADRGGLLPARRDTAVCAERAGIEIAGLRLTIGQRLECNTREDKVDVAVPR